MMMLRVSPGHYVNSVSAAALGLRGEPAYEVEEPPEPAIKPKNRPAPDADNDTPVFNVAESSRDAPVLFVQRGDEEWHGSRIRGPRGVPVFRYGYDGPSIEWRIKAQEARLTSNRYSGQAANDNIDWPLQKTLKAEGADYHLRLAERYRDLWEAANRPTELRGTDLADNVYLLADIREDESTGARENKGLKKVTGKKARLDMPATRAVAADPDQTKKRARAIPKKWQGDLPLLHAIDCRAELAACRAVLGPAREGFEAIVVHGETFEAVGREHGVGNKTGAKGAGRAIVMMGLQALDQHWGADRRAAA